MNVEIGTVAAQFPEKEYINGIFVAVWGTLGCSKFTYMYTLGPRPMIQVLPISLSLIMIQILPI